MADAILIQSLKRPLEDNVDVPSSTPNNAVEPSEAPSTPLTILSTVPSPSPTKSAPRELCEPASSNNSVAGDVSGPSAHLAIPNGAEKPAKRRKLTQQEKEEQRLEKEAKDKARAEKKAQREAEDKVKALHKAQREEEKRLKDEEKRKKNEEKEEKRRAKEFEQQRKEEEKLKKERSQMRLNTFFTKKPGGDTASTTSVDSPSNTSRTSLAPDAQAQDANLGRPSPQKALSKQAKNDYERYFLPFQLPSHAILAPYNRFMEDSEKKAAARSKLDALVSKQDGSVPPVSVESFKQAFKNHKARGRNMTSVAEIVDRINGSSHNPIDLTDEPTPDSQQPLNLLNEIPMKYLHFPEDVRPPYYGTYTKPHTAQEATWLARHPFSRGLKDADYDYDSEAEWEEPEEGEDLGSEGEDDLEEEGEDDMDGFLDDEDDAQIKRRLISGDLEPISTGAISTEFKDFRMGFLLDPRPQSIDPFSTAYWQPEPTVATVNRSVQGKEVTINSMMQPPRMPLTQRPVNGMLNTLNPEKSTGSKAAKPPKRLIPADQLAAFKEEVEGSDLTKLALIEALKKKFPKLPKDAISNTLSTVAARVGAKEVEKRWVLLK